MDDKKMFAEERQRNIFEHIRKNRRATLTELCEKFGVSPATMRNDLDEIQKQGTIKRTHGGAILTTKTSYEPLRSDRSENREAKVAIARRAADYIENGDTVAIDQGTTTYEMVPFLSKKKNITVVVNDIEMALALEKNTSANIIMLGGQVRRNYSSVYGSLTLRCLDGLCVDKLFLATNSISLPKGLTTPNDVTADVKKALVAVSNEIVVLADSSKFGRVSLYKILDCADAGTIITDDGIDSTLLSEFQDSGIHIELAARQ